jgi:hypothetical protein
MVGPAALGVPISSLQSVSVNGDRVGSWPTDAHPWDAGGWIPNAPYVYNDDPTNHGGYVPAGGMTIDGFLIPAGVWVAQFDNFGNQSMIVDGNNNGASAAFPGIVFRGDSWRGTDTAPGFGNIYANSNTHIWILYSDAGGLGAADNQDNEVPFSFSDGTTPGTFFRNYVSYTSSGIQANSASGSQIIENYIEKITLFYGQSGPPGQSGPYHLNGITFNGGETNALVVRNKILLQSPDDAGHQIAQTDAISFFQDFGSFPGTGTNLDGSVGYEVENNYVGGGSYSIYTGQNAGTASTTVQHMVVTGNQVTTQWWPTGGSNGPLAATPAWGSFGNSCSNNTWTDGPNAGLVISC